MGSMKKENSLFDRIISVPFAIAAVLIFFMMLSVTSGVLIRYFRGRPVSELFELTEYGLLFVTFLGAAWVLKKEGHARMDLLLVALNERNRALLNMVTSCICGILWGVIAWFGIKVTYDNFKIGFYLNTMLGPPLYPILAVIPVGSFLLFVQFFRRMLGHYKIWNELKVINNRTRKRAKA